MAALKLAAAAAALALASAAAFDAPNVGDEATANGVVVRVTATTGTGVLVACVGCCCTGCCCAGVLTCLVGCTNTTVVVG